MDFLSQHTTYMRVSLLEKIKVHQRSNNGTAITIITSVVKCDDAKGSKYSLKAFL